MKAIGVVGGIGPESTVDYYRLILARFRERGAAASPRILINSIDLTRLLALAGAGDRAGMTDYLTQAVTALARAGADGGLFAANTPHVVFEAVQRRVSIPLVSIVEATGDAAQALGLKRLGLLGTRFTMQGGFYPDAFAARGMAVVTPRRARDLDYVHEKYLNELVAGDLLSETRAGFLAVIDRMRDENGIEGVILGGTEMPPLLREVNHPLPFLDTTRIHVDAVVSWSLADAH